MHREGHVGLTLIIFSIFLYILNTWDLRSIETLLIALVFSTIPDYDIQIQRLGMKNLFRNLGIVLLSLSPVTLLVHLPLQIPVYLVVLSLFFFLLFAMSEHRKFSHTLAFATICGLFMGFFTLNVFNDFYVGFFGAFFGVISHILGDLPTYTPFSPLYPISRRKVSLKLFKSSNKLINTLLLLIGIVMFVTLYENGTVLRLVSNYVR